MKKVVVRVLFMLMVFQIGILNANASEPVKIIGKSTRKYMTRAVLYQVVAGELQAMARSSIMADGSFGFLFRPAYEGFYTVGTEHEQSLPQDPRGKLDLYFKGGEEVEVQLTDSMSYMTGKNLSKENKVMYKWYQESYQIMTKGIDFGKVLSTYVDFFPELNRVNKITPEFIKGNKTGNKTFDTYLPTYIKRCTMYYAVNLIVTPRKVHPTVQEWDPFYAGITVKNLTQSAEDFYRLPWAVRLLGNVQNLERRRDVNANYRDFDYTLSQTVNDTLKGDVVVRGLEGITNQNRKAFDMTMDKYGKYVVTDVQKARVAAVNVKMAQLKGGDAGLNFEFQDVNGKNVKFSDLKGKVVLIDVWATWCAPCKAEIPHLKKLEEEFKGTDLQTVSISTDNIADKEKWRKMVEKEKLGGIQLFSNSNEEFAKYYKIESIPRFMLFDREGKILSVSSARPSNPELKKLIHQALGK